MKISPQIAVLIQGIDLSYNTLSENDLIGRLCASLCPKMQEQYGYTLYLEYGDRVQTERIRELRAFLTQRYPQLGLCCLKTPSGCDTSIQRVNYLMERAYTDGMDYFYQLNEDVLIIDEGWEQDFIKWLQAHDNFGVILPIDIGNLNCFHHPFVSRKHFALFGHYYPPKLSRSENWMAQVYAPQYRYWSRKKVQSRSQPTTSLARSNVFQQQVAEARTHIAAVKQPVSESINAEDPLISVVMPTHNRANILSKTVDSILQQTHANLELLVIDDASEDETAAVVAAYMRTDARVKYHCLPEQRGPGYARMHGARLAKGDYIALTDDDDISYPPRLEWQLHYLQRHKDMDACCCLYHNERGQPIYPPWSAELPTDKNLTRHIASCPFYLVQNSMFRKTVLLACGYRDFFAAAMEDVDLTLRFQEKYRVGLLTEYLFIYTGFGDLKRDTLGNRQAVRRFFLNLAAYTSASMRRSGLTDPIEEGKTLLQIIPLILTMPTRFYWARAVRKVLKMHGDQQMTTMDMQCLLCLADTLGIHAKLMKTCLLYCRGKQKWTLGWMLFKGHLARKP